MDIIYGLAFTCGLGLFGVLVVYAFIHYAAPDKLKKQSDLEKQYHKPQRPRQAQPKPIYTVANGYLQQDGRGRYWLYTDSNSHIVEYQDAERMIQEQE